MDKVSEMPELADVVPELVCLGIDAAICGVISPDSHLDFPQNCKKSNLDRVHQDPIMILARLSTLH